MKPPGASLLIEGFPTIPRVQEEEVGAAMILKIST
jgi:hypothetical protein